MNRATALKAIGRLGILAAGFAFVAGLVYEAGIWLVPLTDGIDKAILAAINPDVYVPGLDQFFRALTDYTNFLIPLPLISWMVAYQIYRLLPRYKSYITGLLAVETVVVTVMAAAGRMWPNSVYTGANVLLIASCAAFVGLTTYLFYTMDDDSMRRFGRTFWLVLISIYMTELLGVERIKEAVARPRPFNDANKPWNEHVRPIPDEYLQGRNSYPSGHTAATFGLLTPLFWHARSRKVRGGLLAWGCLQGVSRVYTAAHFPSDCLMGGLLGFTTGTLVFFTLWGRSTWSRHVEQSQ